MRMIQTGHIQTRTIEEKLLKGVFEVSVSPLYDGAGELTGCVHVAQDITERLRAEEERHKLEQQLQQTQKLESLGVLAGGIAHDFNNILTIILGHCYINRDNADSELGPVEHFRRIEVAANRAAELCRQMLAYAGKSVQVMTRINLCLAVDEIVKMLFSAFGENVTIDLCLKSDVPAIVGDSGQIQQIIMNLVTNAAEAVGDNCGTVTVRLNKVAVASGGGEYDFAGEAIPSGQYACFEVADSGCGMDEETRRRMFEPFYTTKFTGRGLGLSAVLGIIRSHGGALQITSTLNVGTAIKVYFPLPAREEFTDENSGQPGDISASFADI
jgi:signal transduction histidine kinase